MFLCMRWMCELEYRSPWRPGRTLEAGEDPGVTGGNPLEVAVSEDSNPGPL